ncbi:alpha/beta hydrolase [Streptomyces sp. MNU76]|uniref:alpha/beta hydrolase fold domain-containing protein n=1 Tax=Streptomyces sp. MNU76 TaxID=2560026 RepID=UPI001E4DD86A|nr:alpha/beta hydrolase fold domain-containing protein [Streptomyces sp. MNU76]MCC9710873.1 alpha/beta hydrolase [Streptomyces sp. MNU76]
MSLLARPAVASFAAKAMQRVSAAASRRAGGRGSAAEWRARPPEYACASRELTVPTAYGPARAVLYLPAGEGISPPPVHVNFHGGGYVLPQIELDDALCRCIAVEAGAAVLNVDYVVAPQHPFPAPPRQAYEIVRWVAGHGGEHGWDGDRPSVGGQSAGGGLAAAVARQALEEKGPSIALQVLHYPPLDLATGARDKRAAIARPMLRPWKAAYAAPPEGGGEEFAEHAVRGGRGGGDDARRRTPAGLRWSRPRPGSRWPGRGPGRPGPCGRRPGGRRCRGPPGGG